MFITPKNGRRIFGLLMILAGLGTMAGSLKGAFQARFRTSIAEARILSAHETMMGIGPLRHYSISTKYEFFVNSSQFESEQLVDFLPGGIVYVRFDPLQPENNKLDLSDSSSQFLGVLAGFLILIGTGLVWHTWKPIALFGRTTALK